MMDGTQEEVEKRRKRVAELMKFYYLHHIKPHHEILKEYHEFFADSTKIGKDKPNTTIKERKI